MLPAALRLGSSPKIAATLKNGRRYASRSLVLHVLTVPNEEIRVAFAVSKKVGNSVVRHKVTRKLRQCVAQNIGLIPPGVQIVVRALPESAGLNFAQINEEFVATIKKIVS